MKPNLTSLRSGLSNTIVSMAPDKLMRITERFTDWPISMRMRACPILFVHIPKNGGTLVSEQLYGRHIGHHPADWYKTADQHLFVSKHKLAIIRHPLDRFISAYNFCVGGETSYIKPSKAIKKLVIELGSEIAVAQYLCQMNNTELNLFDPAFHDQAHYIVGREMEVIVDTILSLAQVSGKVISIEGWKLDFSKKVNQSKQLPRKPLTASETDELVCLTEKIYSRDYALYRQLNHV